VEKPRAGDAGTPFAELPATSRDKIRRRATQRALDKLETEAYDKATITRAELRTLDAAE
jgi:hypothetical protein